MRSLLTNNMQVMEDWNKSFLKMSLWKLLLLSGLILTIINLIIFYADLLSILTLGESSLPPGYDFRHYYAIDAANILSGMIPYINYSPYYPLLAEYYFALLYLFGTNVIFARFIQTLVFLACMIVLNDIMKQLDFKLNNWHLAFFLASPVIVSLSIIAINFDILMVLCLLLALDFFLRDNSFLVGAFIGLGIMIKIFPVVLLVPLAFYYARHKRIKDLAFIFLGSVGLYFLLHLPISVLHAILYRQSFFGFFKNFLDFFLTPLTLPEDHALNLPYFFFLTIIPKSDLKMVANIVAVCLITGFTALKLVEKKDPINTFQEILIPVLFIFFLFQPYITPWYLIWILIPRYLRFDEHPVVGHYLYHPLISLNTIIGVNLQYVFNHYVLKDMSLVIEYNFTITPLLIFPMFMNMIHMLLLQLTTVLIFMKESRKRRYIILPLTLICTVIGLIGARMVIYYKFISLF
ncbi:MAG: glycosyltransferase 87 family protein [Candidatus Helarchaeota archaeon]